MAGKAPPKPEDRQQAIEIMRQGLIANGISPDDAGRTAEYLVDEAIRRRGAGDGGSEAV